tara:strand:- start:11313 stop:12251 length:939 start_codon:yes stop_codon:yes gene_type:complete
MEEKKVFSINPDLFTFKSNRTQKKKAKQQNNEKIKIKEKVKNKMKNESLNKKSILKMIRDHHTEKNKEQFSNYETNMKPKTPQGDFEKAKHFFDNMKISNENNHNMTIKNQSSPRPPVIVDNKIKINEPIQLSMNQPLENSEPIHLNTTSVTVPKYGCLKNGNLPTYRDYMNTTRKNNSSMITALRPAEIASVYHQKEEKLKNLKKKKRRYQKKTIKRTYKIGRSRIKPQISVLVSNKTMRNNILEKKQMLNQVPIQDIRRYLIKHGFIKVGSNTPNDVLRQMYISAMMVCGEIQNHNEDNLMYNFLYNQEN